MRIQTFVADHTGFCTWLMLGTYVALHIGSALRCDFDHVIRLTAPRCLQYIADSAPDRRYTIGRRHP